MAHSDSLFTEENELLFLPLGGAGEIGMNLNLLGYDDQWIIMDLGMTFADASLPGADLILPDPTFIVERRDQLLGILLTHAHEDHIGAVAHLWPDLQCPVFATPFTAEIMRGKLAEQGLLDVVPLNELPVGGSVTLGPFKIDYIGLTHSILEPNALAIETPVGRVLHTGDWKIDDDPQVGEQMDEAALRAFGDKGVLALIGDSTNVFNPGTSGSEGSLYSTLRQVIAEQTGRVAVTMFASNIARIATVARVAKELGRKAVLVGRSLERNVGAAKLTGYLHDLDEFLTPEEGAYLPRDKVLYLCTGSQGEAMGAMARITGNSHRDVILEAGDTVVFSSRIIPGNEKTLGDLHNALVLQGIKVVTERDASVHVSGHPCRNELEQMYRWIQPRIAIPVHGEARHIYEHAALAKSLQVPEAIPARNGEVIRLYPGPAKVLTSVESGYLTVDGDYIIATDSQSLVERKRMSYNGHVTIVLVIGADGRLEAEPSLTLAGLPEGLPGEDLYDASMEALEGAINKIERKHRKDSDRLRELVRVAVRRACRDRTGRRPVMDVHVISL